MSIPFDSFSDEQNRDLDESDQSAEEALPVSEEVDLENPEQVSISETSSEAPVDPVDPIDPLISTLPPEAQGETNGGPLGCCLGTVAGLFLTLAVILLVSLSIGNGGYLGWATSLVALLGAVIGGYIGWRIGKRIYREYELSPQRRERLNRVDQEWRSRQRPANRARRTKIG